MNRILTSLLISCFLIAACQGTPNKGHDRPSPRTENSRSGSPTAAPEGENPRGEEDGAINRHPGRLAYSKHARCRMNCRHIDESEVKEILEQGRINYRKSEPAGRPDPKYALEGTTHDGQHVRIVFAFPNDGQKVVVVTVIDLDTEWTCDCK